MIVIEKVHLEIKNFPLGIGNKKFPTQSRDSIAPEISGIYSLVEIIECHSTESQTISVFFYHEKLSLLVQ